MPRPFVNGQVRSTVVDGGVGLEELEAPAGERFPYWSESQDEMAWYDDLRPANSSTELSGGTVEDHSGTQRPIGFLDATELEVTSSRSVTDADWGRMLHNSSGTVTLTVEQSTVGNGKIITLANSSGGNLTIAQGTGVTLTWFDGGGGASGNRTLGDGSICSIWKRSNTVFWIFGVGLA